MDISSILGIWGGILSTILASVKLWEVWKDRLRLSVSLAINPSCANQNVISVTNQYKNTVTIDGLVLFWAVNIKDEKSYKDISTRFNQGCHIEISPFNTTRIIFDEEDYFSIRSDKGKLYLQIYIAGRDKSIVKFLYDPLT